MEGNINEYVRMLKGASEKTNYKTGKRHKKTNIVTRENIETVKKEHGRFDKPSLRKQNHFLFDERLYE